MRKYAGFELLSFLSFHYYFWHVNKLHTTLWMPSRKYCLRAVTHQADSRPAASVCWANFPAGTSQTTVVRESGVKMVSKCCFIVYPMNTCWYEELFPLQNEHASWPLAHLCALSSSAIFETTWSKAAGGLGRRQFFDVCAVKLHNLQDSTGLLRFLTRAAVSGTSQFLLTPSCTSDHFTLTDACGRV